MIPILIFQAGKRSGGRPDYLHLFWVDTFEGDNKARGSPLRFPFILVGADEIDETAERRVLQFLPE